MRHSRSRSYSHLPENRHRRRRASIRSHRLSVNDHIPETYENILVKDSGLKKMLVSIPVKIMSEREYNWRGEPTELLCTRQEFEKFQTGDRRIKKPERSVNSPRRRSRSRSANCSSSRHETTSSNNHRQSSQKRRCTDRHDYKSRSPHSPKEKHRRVEIRPSSREITHSNTQQDGSHPRRSREQRHANTNTSDIQANAANPENQWINSQGIVHHSINIHRQGVVILDGSRRFGFPVDYVYPPIMPMRPHPVPYLRPRFHPRGIEIYPRGGPPGLCNSPWW